MKILHLIPSLRGGGIKTLVCVLANEMVREGHEVTICTISRPENTDYAYTWLDKRVKSRNLGKISIGFSLRELIKVVLFIKREPYDIINIHSYFYYYIFAILLLHSKVTFFYTVHNDAYQENTKWDKKVLWFKRWCFKHKWLHPITISKESKRSFYELYKCESTIIYNGISPIEFIPDRKILNPYKNTHKTKVFVHLGRITTQKNQVVLSKVFERLIKDGYDVKLLIIGKIQDEQIYQSIKAYISERIQYLGERSDAVLLLSGAEALCLPSLWEGMPMTILEALSVGCPVIASPVGGIPEAIQDGYNGMLSHDSSEEQFHSIMVRFLNMSEEQIMQMRENAKKSFAQYNIESTAKQYIETYVSVLNRNNQHYLF